MALQHPLSCKSSMAAIVLVLVGLLHMTGVESIGVCYGKNGNNLPSETDTINLMKSNGIRGLRVYAADPAVFNAVKGSNIDVIADVSNPRLQELTDYARAKAWVQTNIVPFPTVNFKYIAVGNEVYAGNPDSAQYVNFVMPALRNVHGALVELGLQGKIKATTATYSAVLTNTYPPNQGVFQDNAKGLMNPVVQFLAQNGNIPLLANIYPYFSYRGNPSQIPLSYALFTDPNPNSVGYRNLFDALLDSMYAAVQKAGGPNVPIVVSETGWPSDGGFAASQQNAATYYRNLVAHVKGNSGTPMRPGRSIETYLFAMYDENQKGGDAVEKNFGVFRPDKSSKYQLNFN